VLFRLLIASSLPVPLTAIQLLRLNLFTNGRQDVALAFCWEPGLLDHTPQARDESIVRLMIRESAPSGVYMGRCGLPFLRVGLGARLDGVRGS